MDSSSWCKQHSQPNTVQRLMVMYSEIFLRIQFNLACERRRNFTACRRFAHFSGGKKRQSEKMLRSLSKLYQMIVWYNFVGEWSSISTDCQPSRRYSHVTQSSESYLWLLESLADEVQPCNCFADLCFLMKSSRHPCFSLFSFSGNAGIYSQ